ncbi:BON domain-containing protein, partial [uncultured Agrobacterium sp.]|uniref:BON domain-containing protein n=1 Tax=uncultured Agrobacterium sp. TaxID=157277 RepID=UPI0025CF75DE
TRHHQTAPLEPSGQSGLNQPENRAGNANLPEPKKSQIIRRRTVQVEKGWITLRGAVEWQYQKEAAADAVQALSGVLGVTNRIEVKPRVSVADVKKRIEDALKRNAEVEAQKIKINVADGQVVLEGKVDAWSERQAAERAAWAAPGVRSVVDHLRIF